MPCFTYLSWLFEAKVLIEPICWHSISHLAERCQHMSCSPHIQLSREQHNRGVRIHAHHTCLSLCHQMSTCPYGCHAKCRSNLLLSREGVTKGECTAWVYSKEAGSCAGTNWYTRKHPTKAYTEVPWCSSVVQLHVHMAWLERQCEQQCTYMSHKGTEPLHSQMQKNIYPQPAGQRHSPSKPTALEYSPKPCVLVLC